MNMHCRFHGINKCFSIGIIHCSQITTAEDYIWDNPQVKNFYLNKYESNYIIIIEIKKKMKVLMVTEENINKYLNKKYFQIFYHCNISSLASVQYQYIQKKKKRIILSNFNYIETVEGELFEIFMNFSDNHTYFQFGQFIINNNVACNGKKIAIKNSIDQKNIVSENKIENIFISNVKQTINTNGIWEQIYRIGATKYQHFYEVLLFVCIMCNCCMCNV